MTDRLDRFVQTDGVVVIEEARDWQVTRWCCTSGMCMTCRDNAHGAYVRGSTRVRIVHADHVPKSIALRMVAGWKDYDPKASKMDAGA